MNKCDIEAVSALLDGELPEAEAARLLAHIEECPSCRALYQDLAALREGFAELETPSPDTFLPGTVYRYGLGQEPPRSRRVIASLLGIAACLVAVLVISQNVGAPQIAGDGGESVITDLENAGNGADNGIISESNDNVGGEPAPQAPKVDTDENGQSNDIPDGAEEYTKDDDVPEDTWNSFDDAMVPDQAPAVMPEPSPSPSPSDNAANGGDE